MLERYSTIKVKWKNKQKPLLIIPIYVGWTTVLLVSALLSQYYYYGVYLNWEQSASDG